MDLSGPHVQGRRGERFVYLSWGSIAPDGTFAMLRRAKLWLDSVPADVLHAAIGNGRLVARLGLSDAKATRCVPRCDRRVSSGRVRRNGRRRARGSVMLLRCRRHHESRSPRRSS
ncbi:MAG: DUF5990 family protein [Acidimicrobiia bacterium]